MIIDAINVDDLPTNSEEAFVAFEERLRGVLTDLQPEDRRTYRDENGCYTGSYSPERYYVSSILAFLDEYDLEIDVRDISHTEDHEFLSRFNEFFNKINYVRTRFILRKNRMCSGQAGTPIVIKTNFKDEIHGLLNTIRKIVNTNVIDGVKKEAIYKRIAALQSELDRERTTIDAIFGRLIDLSRVVGDCTENVEPLIQKLERVMAALYSGAYRVPLLPKKERTKLLPTPEKMPISDLDDDIPF